MAKVLISLDDRLLERIDQEARKRKLTRSAFVAELAAKELGVPLGPGADPQVHEALRRLEELFRDVRDDWDSTEIIRHERDSH